MEQRPEELDSRESGPQDDLVEDALKRMKPATADHVAAEEEVFDAGEYVRQLIARMENSQNPPIDRSPTKAITHEKAPVEKAITHARTPAESARATSPSSTRPVAKVPNPLDSIATNSIGSTLRPKPAPEQSADLAKLREAANLMTSSALHAFDCNSLVRRAYSQLALSVCAMGTSLVLLSMGDSVASLAFAASVGTLIVSAVATYRYAVTTRVLGEKKRSSR